MAAATNNNKVLSSKASSDSMKVYCECGEIMINNESHKCKVSDAEQEVSKCKVSDAEQEIKGTIAAATKNTSKVISSKASFDSNKIYCECGEIVRNYESHNCCNVWDAEDEMHEMMMIMEVQHYLTLPPPVLLWEFILCALNIRIAAV